MKITNKIASLAAAMSLMCGTAIAGPNLVTNGGFEDGSAGWTMSGMGVAQYGAGLVHSGQFGTATGCVGDGCVSNLGSGSFFGQNLATTVGSEYEMSFWIAETGGQHSQVSVFWNGQMVASALNPNNNSYQNGTGPVQFSVTGLFATSDSTWFEIHGRQDPAGIYFDDVSVTEVGTADVPEPGTLAVLLTGLGLFGATRRAKRGASRQG
jgi:hypothetical protein